MPQEGKAVRKMSKQDFITKIAGYIQKIAPEYDIRVSSPVIAQAILESAFGESKLSSVYHNYFGLKCGTAWKGKSVNMKTQEEYTPGTKTTIRDNFRVYGSMEEGVRGYFEFIQMERYRNLKGITDPQKYLETIIKDGYATSSTYVKNCMSLINEYGLTRYDAKETAAVVEDKKRTAADYLAVWHSWLGWSESNGRHRQIIDIYNSHKPLAQGYKVKYTDQWCDVTVSAAAIKAGMVDLIGTECGVERHVQIFKEKGIWIEDGNIVPEPGYIIVFNWDKSSQPNDGFADHIGVVDQVKAGVIICIEGNRNDAVSYRSIPIGWGKIRGYAAPRYDKGDAAPASSGGAPSKEVKGKGQVTASILNVRSWAGLEHPNIKTIPTLKYGTTVEICDTVKDAGGADWYYVLIDGRIYGFVTADYIRKI